MSRLEKAQARYEKAKARYEAAEGRVGITTRDTGALSGIRRKSTARQRRQAEASIDRTIDAAKELEAAEKELYAAQRSERLKKLEDEQNRAAFCDLDNLKPGDLVRYEQYGSSLGRWGKVVRVNNKTVTLEAPEPGFDQPKIPKDKIRETRTAA